MVVVLSVWVLPLGWARYIDAGTNTSLLLWYLETSFSAHHCWSSPAGSEADHPGVGRELHCYLVLRRRGWGQKLLTGCTAACTCTLWASAMR